MENKQQENKKQSPSPVSSLPHTPTPPPSSSSSSQQQQQQQNNPLVFVNVSNPAAIDSQNVRRLVRSSATRHSHRDPTRKPKSRRADRRTASSSSRSTSNPPPSLVRDRSTPESETAASQPRQSDSLLSPDDKLKIIDLLDQLAAVDEREVKVGQSKQYEAPPNSSYPVNAEEWFPWVLSYYRTVYLPRGVNILQLSQTEGDDFVDWFMREAYSEPALFYMQLLTACTQLVDGDRMPQNHIDWLRGMVVRSINEAISDTTRMMSTATLLAVALIAFYERFYGDKKLATDVHGRAFSRMLEMRGGVERITLPRMMWKLLLWLDILLAPGTGQYDQTTLDLLEAWVPGKAASIQPDA